MLKKKRLECDLCVVGGGMAGMAAAISAAREGRKVVLMHERPVLGGNASSEIRMWICGAHGENNRETGILEEIALENLYRTPTKNYPAWDSLLYDFVRRERNITLLLNCTCMEADVEEGEFPYGRGIAIKSVTGYQMTTQLFYEVAAKHYCDSSGDSILAPLTGADFRIGRESDAEFGEQTNVKEPDRMTMGMSCLIQGRETDEEIRYVAPDFATPLTAKDFEHRDPDIYNDSENFWYLELGGTENTIDDTESLRDRLVGLAAGTWDYVKNSGNFKAENWELDFLGFLPGKRESRRMVGEYTVTQRDISDGRVFEDEIAFGGWPLDDHFPGGFYHRGAPNTYIPTPAPYSLPLRALYSKNVHNLWFAGRNISMTHMAMSSIRVMATCALLGEAVGKAVAVAVENGIAANDVYLSHIKDVQARLLREDCFLPSLRRNVSDACKNAALTHADTLRNGEDRPHRIYGTSRATAAVHVEMGEEVRYAFAATEVEGVHIVFDSDLDRDTVPGTHADRTHSTRANRRKGLPQMCLPPSLCRAFTLTGKTADGEEITLLSVAENCRRAYHVNVKKVLTSLTLTPTASWGDDTVPVISFDFA